MPPPFPPALTALQDLLAEYLDDPGEIKMLLNSAGVSSASLPPLEGSPMQMWHTVLAYLHERGEVRPVVERILHTTIRGGGAATVTKHLADYETGAGQPGTGDEPKQPSESGGTGEVRILIWAANPVDRGEVWTASEIKAITQVTEIESAYRDRFRVVPALAVGIDDLSTSLLRTGPSIVHFSGHSDVEGLTLEDRDRLAAVLAPEPIAELMAIARNSRSVGSRLRLVVFNSCYSQALAEAVVRHVDCVIGTTDEFDDDAAIAFARGLYRGLSAGENVSLSFELGKNAVASHEPGEEAKPMILPGEGVDPTRIRFVGGGED